MTIKKCHLVNNECYKRAIKMDGEPKGIIVHSTASLSPNPYLKRYVQPALDHPQYREIIEDIGNNFYDNSWNNSPDKMGSWACVHAFIGKNEKGEVETYETLPHNYCCWGVGNGSKGSYNYNPQAYLQFEICEDNTWTPQYELIKAGDREYFGKVIKEAQEYCAYICRLYDIPTDRVISHAEAYKEGYGCNHGDIDHWLRIYNLTMDDFRKGVKEIIDGKETKTLTFYRVQVGAFLKKENANKLIERLAKEGYNGFIFYEEETKIYRVQVGAFYEKQNALMFMAELLSKDFTAFIVKAERK